MGLMSKDTSRCFQWHRQKNNALLGMLCENNFFSLCLGLALSSASVLPSAFFLDALSIEHRPLEFCRLIYRLGQMTRPVLAQVTKSLWTYSTYREILPTSRSCFHRSLRLSRYSIAARSRAVVMPNFSEALAFHTLTLPSSDPETTNRASAVNIDDDTL